MEKIVEIIRKGNVVVLTGAGMSTDSGLQDYRGKDGIYSEQDIIELSHVNALDTRFDECISYYARRCREVTNHGPNKGHEVLNRMVSDGLVNRIITQNVDGYHREVGDKVIELHGRLGFTESEKHGVRPSVVMYGERLDDDKLLDAVLSTKHCSALLVLGTSLKVSPANALCYVALEQGVPVIVVDRDMSSVKVPKDSEYAGEVITIEQEITEFLEQVVTQLHEPRN